MDICNMTVTISADVEPLEAALDTLQSHAANLSPQSLGLLLNALDTEPYSLIILSMGPMSDDRLRATCTIQPSVLLSNLVAEALGT